MERRPLPQTVVGGLLGGAISGAAAGAIDSLWTWGRLAQFLPDGGGRVRLLLYVAALYALVGALLGLVTALVFLFFARVSRLGALIGAWRVRHRELRDRDPRAALVPLSLAATVVPVTAGALGLLYLLLPWWLRNTHGLQLQLGVGIAATLGALLIAAGLTFALARLVELILWAIAANPRAARILSCEYAVRNTLLGSLVVVGGLGVLIFWDTLDLLPLRPAWVALAALVLAAPATRIGLAAAARLSRRPAWLRIAVPVAPFLLLPPLVLWSGASAGVRKSADRHSALGGKLTQVIQRAGDFDGDGFSRILGGDDCDDSDPRVHPGAEEIPDDGIDQNCVAGDARAGFAREDTAFAPLPAGLPADFDVLLITIDTLRADHLGAYGYQRPTSPRIDAIAREGVLFASSWAHAPSTRYSMPAIVTGRLPLDVRYNHQVHGWPGLSEDNTTIAEILAGRGLRGIAVLNYEYFGKQRKFDQGFATYDNANAVLHKQVPGKGPAETSGSSSAQQTDAAIRHIDANPGVRLFTWVHYYDPHMNFEKHAEAPDFGDGDVDRYDNEIAFTDLHIGRLVDHLKASGRWGKTVVVITGDHGEGFGEHGIKQHGYHLYAAQTRVPLIIRIPGVGGREVSTPVGHIDILPTLANLAGAPATADMMGRSLVGLATGVHPDEDRNVFQQLSFENNNEMRALVSRRCHVIFNVSPLTSWEVYRIDEDPEESRDRVDSPGPCAAARDTLAAWYDSAQIPAGAAEALLAARPEVATPVDVDYGDEVRLLGVDLPRAPVAPGGRFDVTYTFEAHGPLSGGWHVFAHFNGPGHFKGDHAPVRPFAWWQDGQYIRYQVPVQVPPRTKPGVYQLWTGIYSKSDPNRRRPARSERVKIDGNGARVGEVTIGS
jgi:arylsulfatase A-like enzyme